MALFVDSLFSAPATDASSTPASSGSTPPTTVADSDSQHSDASKLDVIAVAPDDAIYVASVESQAPTPFQSPSSRRPRRARASEPVYNLSRLSGTSDHGKGRANGHHVADRRRKTMSGDTLVGSIDVAADATGSMPRDKTLSAGIDASHLPWSPASLDTPRTRRQAHASPRARRTSLRLAGVSSMTTTLTSMTKNGRKSVSQGVSKLSRELRRLQDTNEFCGVDDRPVVHTVWSNGKYVDPNAPPREPEPPARSAVVKEPREDEEEEEEHKKEEEHKAREEEDKPGEEDKEPVFNTKQRRTKKYLDRGLYAGQDMPHDVFKGLTPTEKKKIATLPELKELNKTGRVNKVMPLPIYTGLRTLVNGRDFKLPFNVCNPLPPGQPKPDEWKKMTKNRFIGDSKDYWRKAPHLHDLSKCVCKPEDGCGDNCQNRIMLYECDAGNCNVGKALCTNRSFADLASRRAKGGKYRIGVEVIKTSDRGHGVRSNRCFQPNQIIMEYTGEIITECYYLMSFDQHMIIDATTGSIARFVNHSCNPNCRMIKWIVSGQPRMALFAGDRPIMTGDELTYDYNFDPFSAKNVQKCLCGEVNCRGVLGPKPRDVKPAKAADLNKTIKATVKAGKRKLKELLGADEQDGNGDGDGSGSGHGDDDDKVHGKDRDRDGDGGNAKKKRKIAAAAPAAGLTRSLSSASLKAARGAASALKKGVSSMGLKGTKKKSAPGTIKASAQQQQHQQQLGRIGAGGAVKKTTMTNNSNSNSNTNTATSSTTTSTETTKATKATKMTKITKPAKPAKPAELVKKSKKAKQGPDGRLAPQMSSCSTSRTIVAGADKGAKLGGKLGSKSKVSPAPAKGAISASTKVISQRASLGSPRRVIKPSPKAKANALSEG
ncbi:hypothetical protein E4U41_000988 [Claviceps citrina]|nr:hypothetical protein E4U41_000988 [Claviceps citrina]